jgi:UDP-N-acetylmuramyl pentapeptide synthase
MKDLQSILFGVSLKQVVGTTQVQVNGIQIDSRKVSANGVFVVV